MSRCTGLACAFTPLGADLHGSCLGILGSPRAVFGKGTAVCGLPDLWARVGRRCLYAYWYHGTLSGHQCPYLLDLRALTELLLVLVPLLVGFWYICLLTSRVGCMWVLVGVMVGVGCHHPSVQWPNTPMDERQRGNPAAVAFQVGLARLVFMVAGHRLVPCDL